MVPDFKSEKISEHITRIFAFNTELVYLVEGSERAVLIDTGSGFGSLRECVESLTQKPLTVLLTHGHTDHALGCGEFRDCDVYINPLEESVYGLHSGLEFRKNSGRMWSDFDKLSDEEIIPPMPFSEMKALNDAMSFNLGDVRIEAYSLPGHTPGSMSMLIPEEGVLLLGDACNYLVFLFDAFSTDVATYRESLISLEDKLEGKYSRVILSHGNGEGEPDMLRCVIRVCDDLLAGISDEMPFEFLGQKPLLAKRTGPDDNRADGGKGNIVYRKEKL